MASGPYSDLPKSIQKKLADWGLNLSIEVQSYSFYNGDAVWGAIIPFGDRKFCIGFVTPDDYKDTRNTKRSEQVDSWVYKPYYAYYSIVDPDTNKIRLFGSYTFNLNALIPLIRKKFLVFGHEKEFIQEARIRELAPVVSEDDFINVMGRYVKEQIKKAKKQNR
jgi:hypothetical protein